MARSSSSFRISCLEFSASPPLPDLFISTFNFQLSTFLPPPMPRHLTSMTGHRTPDTGPTRVVASRAGSSPSSGLGGSKIFSHEATKHTKEEANCFHSHEASRISREANGLVHASPGQGRLGRRRPRLRPKKNPQAEGLPHHSAKRRLPRDEAGLQPAIDSPPSDPGPCPGLVCRRPLASKSSAFLFQSKIINHQSTTLPLTPDP